MSPWISFLYGNIFRVDHNSKSDSLQSQCKATYLRNIPKIPWEIWICVLSHRSTSFTSKYLAIPETIPSSPNPFTPSFTVQWDLTILSCCQSPFMWSLLVSPSHSPIGLQSSTGTAQMLLQTETCEYCIVCAHYGPHDLKILNIYWFSFNKISSSPAVWGCLIKQFHLSPLTGLWIPHWGMLVQNILGTPGSVVKHHGESCPSGFRQ